MIWRGVYMDTATSTTSGQQAIDLFTCHGAGYPALETIGMSDGDPSWMLEAIRM